ncbi:MAG: FISUMP domain-containing protein [Candidatus Falkowbacteria bacterium]
MVYFKYSSQSKKIIGFTLIELLVVIVIIGILASIAFVAIGTARSKARDAQRVADIKQLQSALEVYFANNNAYPSIITSGQILKDASGVVYLNKVPAAPTVIDGDCADITGYTYTTSTRGYALTYCLGAAVQNAGPGKCVAYQGNICGVDACGDNINYYGDVYPTVQIGSQCWFAKSLNIGTRINATTTAQSNNGVIEKYCYNDSALNCDVDSYGGLYQVNEALNYSAADSNGNFRGICPKGWHVPKGSDFWPGFLNVGGSPNYGLMTSWYCGGCTNSTGFSAFYYGQYSGGAYLGRYSGSNVAWFQTADHTTAGSIQIVSGPPMVSFAVAGSANDARVIRCLKD